MSWRNRDVSDTKGQTGELSRYVRESVEMLCEVLRVKLNHLAACITRAKRASVPQNVVTYLWLFMTGQNAARFCLVV